jgi:hypothetical protein
LLITLGLFILVPIRIAIAGFNVVIHSDNPGTISKEGKVILNTVLGIVIALAAWLIVDAVMAVLTTGPSGTTFARNWSSIVNFSGNTCLIQAGSLQNLDQSNVGVTGVSASGVPITGGGVGNFTFASGISAQVPTESPALASLLSCMSGKLTSNVVITSISDSAITSGKATFQQCAAQGTAAGCAHTVNSCHYGGRNCVGSSYAVDLSGDATTITNAAKACNASVLNEGNHLHVSVGAQNGCGCDTGLTNTSD